MDDAPPEAAVTDPAQADDLRGAVAALASEVQALADRVAHLGHAVEALAPTGKAGPSGHARPAPGGDSREAVREEPERFRVVVAPVSELALAAVAETSLRSLPGVRRVIEVSRSETEVRFELEVQPDFKLVDPLRTALPVPFDIASEDEGEIVITLRPAWGPAPSS